MAKLFIGIDGKCEEVTDKDAKKIITVSRVNDERIFPKTEMLSEEDELEVKLRTTLKEDDLYVCYAQSFSNDDYHKDATDVPSELENRVRGLKRRYADFAEYQEGLAIYNEYMEYLYDKYNCYDKKFFKLMSAAGMIDDYIPSKPRIKPTKRNKFCLKNRVVIGSKTNPVNEMSVDDLEFVADDMFGDRPVIEETNVFNASGKKYDNLASRVTNSRRSKNNEHAYLTNSSLSSLDYLEEYFNVKAQYSDDTKDCVDTEITLTDLLEGNFMTKEEAEGMSDKDEMVVYNGTIMSSSKKEEMKVYNTLQESGWDAVAILKSNGVKADTSDDIVSKKLSKLKKKHKKDAKKSQNAMALYESESYGDFQEEMMSFNADDLYK